MRAEETGKLPGYLIDISPGVKNNAFGMVITGTLIMPREGDYEFQLDSTDGARLLIDGNVLIKYDGVHPLGQQQKARVHLPEGRMSIRIDYFHKQGEPALHLYWGGPFGHHVLFKTNNPRKRRPIDMDQYLASDGERLLGESDARQLREARQRMKELKDRRVPAAFAFSAVEMGSHAPDTMILGRGNVHSPGEKLVPGFPAILAHSQPVIPAVPDNARSSGRRTALAAWLASTENTLAARVMVNRIWQHHFGRGIVRSPNNFGDWVRRRRIPSCSIGWQRNSSKAAGGSSRCIG